MVIALTRHSAVTLILSALTTVRANLLIALGMLLVSVTALALDGYEVDPATGFRMERYRAPVPADIPGGITLDNQTAVQLHASGELVFIDVYPPKGLGPDPLDGHWVTSEIRESIPGAFWLPEVGRGTLLSDAEGYFQHNLTRLTDGNKSAPVAFFCTADCWQSWNAARRAIGWGYSAVHWYPLGSDGWLEMGKALDVVQPINFLDASTPSARVFPDTGNIFLIDQQGNELAIGTVDFSAGESDAFGVVVDINSTAFEDQFLSMRPFKCLTESSEWFCYLPYPYELGRTVTPTDLTELEYQLLFIWKSPKSFGIDAWNGVYYQLTLREDGTLIGNLLQGDLNVLANPPEPNSHPIDLAEFIQEGAQRRRYPSLIIRP